MTATTLESPAEHCDNAFIIQVTTKLYCVFAPLSVIWSVISNCVIPK